MGESITANKINIKWVLIWILLHSFSLWIIGLALNKLSIQKNFLYLILTGLGLVILANIYRIFLSKRKFIINKYFIYWFIIDTFTIWIVWKIMEILNIQIWWLVILLTGTGLEILALINHKIKKTNLIMFFISVVLIAILIYFNLNQINLFMKNNFYYINDPDSNNLGSDKNTSSGDFFIMKISFPDLGDIEKQILILTNAQRKSNGLSELVWDDKLAEVARDHSKDMAINHYLDHINQNGESPTARAIRHGYDVHKELDGGWYSDGIAENIGKMPTGNVVGVGYVSSDAESIAKAQVSGWMSSPGHRANILNKDYAVIGVGVAYDSTYYIATQNFK